MIFEMIKNLFNKNENTEKIEYLGVDKDGNKIYEGYYHEFKGIPWGFNKTTYTREELLFKLHNLMANKELGDHVFFEGIEYEGHECEGYGLIDNEDGIPVFFIVCGS